MKFLKSEQAIQIYLWGLFFGSLILTALNGITPISTMASAGILLLAVDYSRKKRKK